MGLPALQMLTSLFCLGVINKIVELLPHPTDPVLWSSSAKSWLHEQPLAQSISFALEVKVVQEERLVSALLEVLALDRLGEVRKHLFSYKIINQ